MADFGKINLSAFKHVIMERKGKSGMVKGVFLPIEANNFFLSEKGNVFVDIVMFESDKIEGMTHSIKQSLPKEVRDKMTDDEKKSQPFIGNVSIWKGGAAREINNNPEPEKTYKENDDLPF